MATVTTVSWKDKQLREYIKKVTETHFPGNESAAIMDCVRCHQHVTRHFPDWRLVANWTDKVADELMTRLKALRVVDGNEDEIKQEIKRSFKINEQELFE